MQTAADLEHTCPSGDEYFHPVTNQMPDDPTQVSRNMEPAEVMERMEWLVRRVLLRCSDDNPAASGCSFIYAETLGNIVPLATQSGEVNVHVAHCEGVTSRRMPLMP